MRLEMSRTAMNNTLHGEIEVQKKKIRSLYTAMQLPMKGIPILLKQQFSSRSLINVINFEGLLL